MSLPPLDDGDADDGGTDDADDGHDPTPGGPPHPMDRIWRHPSELPTLSEPSGRAAPRLGPGRLRSLLVPLGAGALGALFTVAVLAAAGAFDQRTVIDSGTHPSGAAHTSDAIETVAKRVAPAIVAVRVSSKTGSRSGSGVCIRHAGQILTSARLVAGARRIELVSSDGTIRTAHVLGIDTASDLALLSTDGDLEAADLASAAPLQIGAAVYAVGADSTGRAWVTEGIVSSLDTRVATDGTTMTGLIESNALTEAAVAGGALLDDQGRVAGIVMTPASGHPTIVAVPIELASRVADGLRTSGHVDHGWLGLAGKVTSHGQFVVTAIAAGGPSARAGIEVGDVVVDADSQPVTSMEDLMAAARGHWPGDRIPIELTRDHADLTVSVRLARMPATTTATTPATTTVAATTVGTTNTTS